MDFTGLKPILTPKTKAPVAHTRKTSATLTQAALREFEELRKYYELTEVNGKGASDNYNCVYYVLSEKGLIDHDRPVWVSDDLFQPGKVPPRQFFAEALEAGILKIVDPGSQQPGDIMNFVKANGSILHTGIIKSVPASGDLGTSIMEGKNGIFGVHRGTVDGHGNLTQDSQLVDNLEGIGGIQIFRVR